MVTINTFDSNFNYNPTLQKFNIKTIIPLIKAKQIHSNFKVYLINMRHLIFLLILIHFVFVLCTTMDYDIIFERFEQIKGDEETLVEYNLRIRRQGHGQSNMFINGYMIYKEDFGEEVDHTITSAFSPHGTTQFRNHPYTVQKSNICEMFRTHYRKYIQDLMLPHTNFPYVPEEGICPIPKGNYTCVNMKFDKGDYPSQCPRGLWKVEQIYEKQGKLIGGLRIFLRIVDKFD
ncbi:uncharacterized protein LOC129907730 [Episyrphus balteatus]|uniref:uncharacterized protein LOC129907730 n=1 Tax=Episyrphus balteatus TaxID=286459 RepID=UPI0024863560|nr:uncharacterized protein LOC129907730 [Episyrphus balteatus]